MAYDIPVAALILDEALAASLINEDSNFFENESNDRHDGVERLAKITGAPISSFSSEDGSVYFIGLHLEEDWRIDINGSLITKAAAAKTQYPHPLVQSAKLAVVSTFC